MSTAGGVAVRNVDREIAIGNATQRHWLTSALPTAVWIERQHDLSEPANQILRI